MVKKTFLVLICFISLIIFVSTLHSQGSKKTITLPSGEVVYDLNGEWDALVETYGPMAYVGSYPQIHKIMQAGSAFIGVRMIDDPNNLKGWQSLQGELDKSGFKRVTMMGVGGSVEGKGQISEDGNKIVIDSGGGIRWTLTRK